MFLMRDKEYGGDPKTTMLDINSEKWLNAMKSKVDSMYSNQV